MVRDLMTNCRHLLLFLVVQKILAWFEMDHSLHCYHWMHFTNGFEKKLQLQQDINIIAHSQNQTSFFQKELRQFLFIWYGHATTKKVSHKVDEKECRWAKCAPSDGNSVGASGARLRALSSRSEFVVFSSARASRNRTFPVSLQPRGFCDRR